jgi:hypothetical protein
MPRVWTDDGRKRGARRTAEPCRPCLAWVWHVTRRHYSVPLPIGSTVTNPNMSSSTKWGRTPQITR